MIEQPYPFTTGHSQGFYDHENLESLKFEYMFSRPGIVLGNYKISQTFLKSQVNLKK